MQFKYIPLVVCFFLSGISLGSETSESPLIANIDLYRSLPDSSRYEALYYFSSQYQGVQKTRTKAMAHLELALFNIEQYNYEKAIENCFDALQLFSDLNDLTGIATSYNRIGNCFQRVKNTPKAEYYYGLTLDIALHQKDSILQASCYNNLAGLYYASKDYTTSEKYFERSLGIFEQLALPNYIANTKINYSVVLMESKPEKALEVLLESQEYYNTNASYMNKASIDANIGAVYFRQNKPYDALENYFISLKTTLEHDYKVSTAVNFKDISEIYESIGDYQNALLYHNKYDSINAHILSDQEKEMASQIEFDHYMDLKSEKTKSLSLKYEKVQLEKRELSYLFWLLTIVLVMVVLMSIFGISLYQSRSKRLQHKRELLLLKNKMISNNLEQSQVNTQNLEKQLKMSKEDLINFSIDIRRKAETQQTIHQGIKELKRFAVGDKNMMNELNELLRISTANIKMNADSDLITSNIDKVNHDFFSRLAEKFPNLTTNEKKLCGLIRIKTSIHEIATIRGISPKSVEMSRYRLKKKMKLDEQQQLDQFIEQI